jgi:hypothetical protein
MFNDDDKSCQLAKKDPLLMALPSAPSADVYKINIKPGLNILTKSVVVE